MSPDTTSGVGRDQKVPLEEVLEVFEESDEAVLGTKEVAGGLDVSRPTASGYLDRLEKKGLVEKSEIGQVAAWYLPGDENRRLTQFTEDDDIERVLPDHLTKRLGDEEDDAGEIRPDGGKTSLEGVVDGGLLGGFVVGIVGVLALLFSPSSELLVSVARGGWATVAIMIPLRGLRIDRRIGRWFDGVRDTVDDEGGPVAFIKRRASEESLGPENPRTPIERVARYDLRAFVLFIIASTLASLISGIYYTVGFEPFVGTPVVELLVLLSAAVVLLFTLGTILLWTAIFASVLIERARMQAGTEQPVGGSNG